MRRNRWCNICKNTTHDTNYCRKKSSINNLNSQENKDESFNKEEHNFAFNVVHNNKFNVNNTNLLVDCGATAHIINDESLFINKNLNFDSEKHFIELADGSKKNNIVLMRGDAKILLYDVNNKPHDVILKNALCIPSYKQNIFSVQSAIKKGAKINFSGDTCELETFNGTTFNINQKNNLYFLNNISNSKINSNTLFEWHRILGHCNTKDVIKLQNKVLGMNITDLNEKFECDICTLGKMNNFRNRKADNKAKNILDLVHCDLAGPIDPIAKDILNILFLL